MTSQFLKKARLGQHASPTCLRFGQTLYSFRVFDKRMAAVDIRGSLAHAEMLQTQNIISAQDYADIQRGHGAN